MVVGDKVQVGGICAGRGGGEWVQDRGSAKTNTNYGGAVGYRVGV